MPDAARARIDTARGGALCYHGRWLGGQFPEFGREAEEESDASLDQERATNNHR
jgi:hypothetical protein